MTVPATAQRSWYLPENRVRVDPYQQQSSKRPRADQVHALRYQVAGIGASIDSLNSLTDSPAHHARVTALAADNDSADRQSISAWMIERSPLQSTLHSSRLRSDSIESTSDRPITTAAINEDRPAAEPSTPSIKPTTTSARGVGVGPQRRLFAVDEAPVDVTTSSSSPGPSTVFSSRTPSCVYEHTSTQPYLSPLVLRKELENVLASDEGALAHATFLHTHATLFWNLVHFYRRLQLPTHMVGWLRDSPVGDRVFGINDDELADHQRVPAEHRRILVSVRAQAQTQV